MKELGINQPSLSKRLKYLQHAGPLLERPWLVRNGKTWELTDEGRRVWPAVAELVDRYDNLETFIERRAMRRTTAVRFACGQLMAAGIVREALGLFQQEQPRTRLRISTLRGRARIEGVSSGSLDLAIVSHDEPSIAQIARRPLSVEPLVSHGLARVCPGFALDSRCACLAQGRSASAGACRISVNRAGTRRGHSAHDR